MVRDFKGVWIPKEVWLSSELTMMEKLFLVEIDSLDNNSGCYASNAHFSEFFELSKGRCTQIIRSLEAKGIISIMLDRNGKQVVKRTIKVVRKLNTLVNKLNNPSEKTKQPYLENDEVSNTKSNNTSLKIQDDRPYQIMDHLNLVCKKKLRAKTYLSEIKSRLNDGYTVDDFVHVHLVKASQWLNTDNEKYLNPTTLYRPKNFDKYLNETITDSAKMSLVKEHSGMSASQIRDEMIGSSNERG